MKYKITAKGKTFKKIFSGLDDIENEQVYKLILKNVKMKDYLEMLGSCVIKPKKPKFSFTKIK